MSDAATLEGLTAKITRAAEGKPGFGKSIVLDLGAEGAIRIDGAGETIAVSNAAEPEPETTVALSAETLQGLMAGKVNAPMAVMTGKIKIRGETALAMKLASFLG